MQLQQLRALVGVADTGSISATAKALGQTQPGITRALQQLEIAVGTTLLVRSAHGVALTECGTALLTYARSIVSAADDGLNHVRQLAGDRSGRVVLASSAAPFGLVVPQAIALLRRRFPDVAVELVEVAYPPVMDLFRDHVIDFAIGPLPAAGPGDGMRRDRLFDLELVVIVPPGHPKARARSLRQLVDLPWMITGPRAGPGAVHAAAFARAGLQPPQSVLRCESVGAAIQLVRQGSAASFVPRHLAQDAAAAGLVAIVPLSGPLPTLEICAFMPARKILTPAGQALYSALHSVSRALAPQ